MFVYIAEYILLYTGIEWGREKTDGKNHMKIKKMWWKFYAFSLFRLFFDYRNEMEMGWKTFREALQSYLNLYKLDIKINNKANINKSNPTITIRWESPEEKKCNYIEWKECAKNRK